MEGKMKIPVIGTVVVIALIAVAAIFAFTGLEIADDWESKIWPLIGTLFIVSLFMERSIEVFLSAFRAGVADQLDLKIKEIKKELDQLNKDTDPDNYKKVSKELADKNEERAKYRIRSRQWALWGGLTLGILVALVGFHGLENLIDPKYFKNPEPTTLRLRLFHAVDVLVTGAVLAGGSDAFNKIMKLYSAFTETAAQNTRAKKSNADAS